VFYLTTLWVIKVIWHWSQVNTYDYGNAVKCYRRAKYEGLGGFPQYGPTIFILNYTRVHGFS
jgi:hypothetical protein